MWTIPTTNKAFGRSQITLEHNPNGVEKIVYCTPFFSCYVRIESQKTSLKKLLLSKEAVDFNIESRAFI